MLFTEVLLDQVRWRIVQYLIVHGDATTKELADNLQDVPRRTLYRHVNFLIDAGAVTVKEERKVRGSTERLLTENIKGFIDQFDYGDKAYQFFMDMYLKFANYSQRYGDKANSQAEKDQLCFGTSVFYLDDDEMQAMLNEIYEIGIRYEKKHKEKYGNKTSGKLRNVSFISAPEE
jgi:predicted transcriptional regulator